MNIEQIKCDIKELIISTSLLAGKPLLSNDFTIIHLPIGNHPISLLQGKIAIYSFVYNGEFLKIGQAGEKSNARYKSQHYIDFSSTRKYSSTLARSLNNDPTFNVGNNVKQWIIENCERIDIIFDTRNNKHENKKLLNFIEGLLHYKYNPKYEG